MEQRKPKRREPAPAVETEQMLATYYGQLLKWGAVLTRGDAGKAQDLVQEFCLYFTLTRPNLSEVANLDGYLYTCLRHIYLSSLARASREALHFVSIADFDSFDFAIAANQVGDPLQRQNDLRRICGYTVWRKEQSKSASYFILHFFHGYSRREIAELARLPISAIYNKLKTARTEVKSHLDQSGKLRMINRDSPPPPRLSWSLLSPVDLFKELRETVLNARTGSCLPEEALLAHYRSPMPNPIPCSLLAHIVSCERCLGLIDNHFRRPTLTDREALDGSDPTSVNTSSIPTPVRKGEMAMLQSVRRRWGRIHEHRPQTLSIAVNGKIVASHDVQSQHSTLSARVEVPQREQFIEVFSEQDVRLALLSLGELPPDGPHVMTQRVALSDSRWLELNLTFDGLGLSSQVAYFDPALAIDAIDEEIEDPALELAPIPSTSINSSDEQPGSKRPSIYAAFLRYLRPVIPSSAMAGALILAVIVGGAGYFAYRHANVPMDAEMILNQSVKIEMANLQGQTEHQIIRLEEVAADGKILQQGSVDLWKDGDGSRYVRRLYNSRHQLVAATWRDKGGEHKSPLKERGKDASRTHHPSSMNGLWNQDLSASAFRRLAGKETRLVPLDGGYELATVEPIKGHPQLISATLVLDRHLSPVRQTMRVRTGAGIHEVRFIQTDFERRPSSAVPDAVFDPEYVEPQSVQDRHSSLNPQEISGAAGIDVQLAQLQVAVLYQLNNLGADIGEPIEVMRTPEGHIRISGTVADSALKQEIVSHLKTLEDHELLNINLISPHEMRAQASLAHPGTPEDTSVYDINQGKPILDATLRRYLEGKGLSGTRLNSAVEQYSHAALQHAQRALQNAYALDRLGSALSATELNSIGLASQLQWTEMVGKHSVDLEEQLRGLQGQLTPILPQAKRLPEPMGESIQIESSAQFNSAAGQILRQTQKLNEDVGKLFTYSPLVSGQLTPESLLTSSMRDLPLRQAEELSSFAAKLKASEKSGAVKP
jgi:DNA-directed RNA polymerase specialized sigma24 family protein